MQNNYSYFLMKPDGAKKFKNINLEIKAKFNTVYYFAVKDWESITKKLYHKHYEKKGKAFAESFQTYIDSVLAIYNNYSILILVSNGQGSYERLVSDVLALKQHIRKQYGNSNIAIVSNNVKTGEKKNYIRVISKNGKIEDQRYFEELGNHRINSLNVIHSPDASIESTIEELNILFKSGIITKENMLNQETVKKMEKYGTMAVLEDLKDRDYTGVTAPDIAGFIKKQVNNGTKQSESIKEDVMCR